MTRDIGITAIVIFCGVLITSASLFMGVMGFLSFEDWNYSHKRARVDTELEAIGIRREDPDYGAHQRQPNLSVPSPDGAWTLIAEWVDVRGYNWGVRNNRTGKVYLRLEHIRPDNWFPPHLDILWSPDSSFVAVTSEDGVEVATTQGGEARYTELTIGNCGWQKNSLLSGVDTENFAGWCGRAGQMKALQWTKPNELAVSTCIDVRMKNDNSERVVGAHLVLRFMGRKFDLVSKNCDFYESLPYVD